MVADEKSEFLAWIFPLEPQRRHQDILSDLSCPLPAPLLTPSVRNGLELLQSPTERLPRARDETGNLRTTIIGTDSGP